jgi:hypothetical protein
VRVAAFVLLLAILLPVAYAQEPSQDNPGRTDDEDVQQIIDKLRNLQPPRWTYSELASQADAVVIAKLRARSEIEWQDDIGGDFGKEATKLIANRLQVLSVLKGQCGDEIEVMTLEWAPNVIVLVNHDFAVLRTQLLLPSMVSIEIDGQIIGYGGSIDTYKIEPEYLLYLRRLDDDKYVPVTGQQYAGMSVRLLND